MKKILLIAIAGSLLIFNSCKKGDRGPAGPVGPQGNANVIGTNSFTVGSSSSNAWDYNSGTFYATFNNSGITQDIVDHGSVEIFKLYPNGWTNLPDIDGNVITVFNFDVNTFTISVLTTDGSIPNNPGSVTFRAVIISASQKAAHPNTNWKNYNEAMAALSSPGNATVIQ